MAALAALLLTAVQAQPAKHVIIVTIDGFRPDFYLDSAWRTPHLRELLRKGVYAYGVNSVMPSITYPSHTTIVTGVWPDKHGVYYNNKFNEPGWQNKMYWNDTSIHAPTLWAAVHAQGKKVAALLWPVSADAPVDYNIPDIGSLGDSIREAYSKPAGFVDDLKKEVFNGASKIEYGKNTNVAKIAAYVINNAKPALMTVHFFSVDHAEHTVGRTGQMVEDAIADADSGIGIIEDAIAKQGMADKTVLIVTGDHGFKNVTANINPNVWLAKAGLITNAKNNEWKAMFYSAGGSAFLYLKDNNDRQTEQEVLKILNNQPDSVKKYFTIVSRHQMNSVGGNPTVAFALTGENGAAFGNAVNGEAIRPGKGGTHGYFPNTREIQTGFIAVGPGLKSNGTMIKEMNLRDIAPLVSKLLGVPFPSAEGKIPAGILIR
jgi:predicted AlkP superfamily pyrophosphatase or phosphodiesterase